MDEEDKKPESLTQIPLLKDMIFDSALALRSPKKSRSGPDPASGPSTVKSGSGKDSKKHHKKTLPAYSPEYDPGTLDLFAIAPPSQTDQKIVAEGSVQETTSATGARATPNDIAEDVPESQPARDASNEISRQLRAELTDQLTSILADLELLDELDQGLDQPSND